MMLRVKEVTLGILLIIFVLGATVTSVLWGNPASAVPQDDWRPALTLAEPVEQAAPLQPNHHAWRDVFPVVYLIVTVVLVMFAGLICAVNCFRQFLPFDKILNKFQKTKRINCT